MGVVIEESVPLQALLRLSERGPAGLADVLSLCGRGDWKARALALSAVGVVLRAHPTARPAAWRRAARRLPLARRFIADPVAVRGRYVDALGDRLADPAWIVRSAAALALGACGDARSAPRLAALLADPFRPVRLCAAAARAALSNTPAPAWATLLDGADAAPARIGDTAAAGEWLGYLATAHRRVLTHLAQSPDAPAPLPQSSSAWAALLAGESRVEDLDSKQAEIVRYAQEKDTHYHFTKPFTPVNRDENVRLLQAFLAVAEHLRAPQGARVLDLGGGPGWVSELLAKLGYTPVTLDLAPALLRIGRERFRREHLPGRLVCGDMTALPFPDASFDAVVVIDALHHVPDVPAVFREAFRVLGQGGRFLLAEPGEGHSETTKSRAEMLEHGVAEREIHLFEAISYARAAGFDAVAVVPHHVPDVTLSPEDFKHALRAPTQHWRVERDGQRLAFDEYLLHSLLAHPIMVSAKGARTLDTRAPRELRAVLRPALQREGARLFGAVEVENVGDTLWLRSAGESVGHVRLGLQLMTPERRLLNQDFARGVLSDDVAPGASARVEIDLLLPDATASYVVKLDLVDEHVCWFEDRGNRPVYLALAANDATESQRSRRTDEDTRGRLT